MASAHAELHPEEVPNGLVALTAVRFELPVGGLHDLVAPTAARCVPVDDHCGLVVLTAVRFELLVDGRCALVAPTAVRCVPVDDHCGLVVLTAVRFELPVDGRCGPEGCKTTRGVHLQSPRLGPWARPQAGRQLLSDG